MTVVRGFLRVAALATIGLSCCAGSHVHRSTPAPSRAISEASKIFVVAYRPVANTFEILDNVSRWWPEKSDPEYRAYWDERFGRSAEDDKAFETYARIRRRYYPALPGDADPHTSESGLFAPRKAPDRVADAFYRAETVAGALTELQHGGVAPEDVTALETFFAAFEPRVKAVLAESQAFDRLAAALQSKLDDPKTLAHARRIAHAYGLNEVPRFTVLWVWWPPVDHVTANNRGSVLLMKYHPVRHAEDAARDADIPVHELVHFVSSRRSEDEKRARTRTFLSGCDVTKRVRASYILEEPLAVAFQKLYLREASPDRVDWFGSWYGNPWVGVFAKTLVNPLGEHLDAGGAIDEAFMRRSARLCAQIRATAAMLEHEPEQNSQESTPTPKQ